MVGYSKQMFEKAFSVFGAIFLTFLIMSFWIDNIWNAVSNSKVYLLAIFFSIIFGEYIRNKRKIK